MFRDDDRPCDVEALWCGLYVPVLKGGSGSIAFVQDMVEGGSSYSNDMSGSSWVLAF